MKPSYVTALVSVLAAPAAAFAEPQERYFDPNHTQVSVDWVHAAGAPLTFYFTEWDGEVLFDADEPANSSVNVVVPLSGLWTGVDRFTGHLQSGDFFEAETWPEARFVSTAVEVTGEDTATLTGDLTIKDRTAPVTFDVEMKGSFGEGEDARTGFKAWTTLSRSEWGLGYGEAYAEDEVKLVISTELLNSPPD